MEAHQTWNREEPRREPQRGFTLDAPPLRELDQRTETAQVMAATMLWLSAATVAAGFSVGVWVAG
jgi:hypothetical protein